jgi:hypothetical protein
MQIPNAGENGPDLAKGTAWAMIFAWMTAGSNLNDAQSVGSAIWIEMVRMLMIQKIQYRGKHDEGVGTRMSLLRRNQTGVHEDALLVHEDPSMMMTMWKASSSGPTPLILSLY